MKKDFLEVIANIFAAIGIVVCAISGINRIFSTYHVFGYGAMALFIGGISLMVLSALIKIHIIQKHISRNP